MNYLRRLRTRKGALLQLGLVKTDKDFDKFAATL